MKLIIALAVICAVAAIGFLIATMFIPGTSVVWPSIGAGLSLVAFILLLVAYTSKATK